jgi:23S rRNA (cytosine1962-C5)-methyltransferase
VASERTTAFRLINGEGDFLPGVVVDYYEGYAVIVLDSPALEVLLPWLVDALQAIPEAGGIRIRGILQRRRGKAGATQEEKVQPVWGKPLPAQLIISENGLRLRANLLSGQKTGLFLDHRDNRARIEACAKGRRVLNLFAYSGAFSLYAARGGATRVTSVDLAEAALADARENFRLNGFDAECHELVTQDAFAYLKDSPSERAFDLVIVDPPSFARRMDQVKQAKKAYARLFALAAARVSDGGYLALGSCTARVSPEDFRSIASDAVSQTRASLQIIAETGHAPDHPVQSAHPEGRYLKFILGRISR